MRTTIRDVAQRAGVSVATVSRVFNNSGPVGKATRKRIEQVARELRYTPNRAARSLITSKTHVLGLLLPDLFGEFFSEIMRGIDQEAQRHEYHLLVSSSHHERETMVAALQAMRGRVDGLVVMAPDIQADALRTNLPENLPVVLLNCFAKGSAWDAINIDNVGGARQAVEHLVALGHRCIAIVTGDRQNHDASQRLRGYQETLEAHGLSPLIAEGDFRMESGYRAAQELLQHDPRPTAIFASNDAMAIGVMRALHERDVAVPDDVSVVGFDDVPMAPFVSPPLTTVGVAIDELGAQAVHRVLDAIRVGNQHDKTHTVVPTHLVVRASSGVAPILA